MYTTKDLERLSCIVFHCINDIQRTPFLATTIKYSDKLSVSPPILEATQVRSFMEDLFHF